MAFFSSFLLKRRTSRPVFTVISRTPSGKYHVSREYQTFVGDTVLQIVDNDLFVLLPAEKVNPLHQGQGDEMRDIIF